VRFALLGVAPTFLPYLIILGSGGIVVPVLNSAGIVMIQEIPDEDKTARVFPIVRLLRGSVIPLAVVGLIDGSTQKTYQTGSVIMEA
jgi:DHA3 family macrolide efflux protein-like MFS transporter